MIQSLKPLHELSDVELEALADAVEAGKPLDYPYFRWAQHVRRYALFYWTTLLFVMMGISIYKTSTSYMPLMAESSHWKMTLVQRGLPSIMYSNNVVHRFFDIASAFHIL